MPALSHNVIEKFTALNSGEKSKKLIGMSKLNHNMIRRVSLLKTKGGLNSTIDQENIQKLIQQNNQTKFVHFDDAIYAFWKHSQKIAMKVLAEKVEKKRDNHSRSNLESTTPEQNERQSACSSSITHIQLPTDPILPELDKPKITIQTDNSPSNKSTHAEEQNPDNFEEQLQKLKRKENKNFIKQLQQRKSKKELQEQNKEILIKLNNIESNYK